MDLRAWSEFDHRYDSEVRDLSELDSLAELRFLSERARERDRCRDRGVSEKSGKAHDMDNLDVYPDRAPSMDIFSFSSLN